MKQIRRFALEITYTTIPIPAFQVAQQQIRKFVDSYGRADSCLLQAGVIRYLHEVKSR